MKKYLKLLVAGLVFVLAACGGGNDNSKPTPSSPSIPGGPSVSTPTPSVSTPAPSVENIGETMERIDEIIKGYVPSVVDGDITLPTSIEGYNIYILWSSSHPDVISTSGKYTKPLNDETVVLTASYEYKGIKGHTVEATTTVHGYTDEEKLDFVKGEMSKPEIDATHTSFTLITENDLNATITWEVSGSEYAIINENTFSLAEDAFLNGASFELKVTIELNEKTAEVIYEYEIAIDYSLRLAKAKAEIAKPELVDNKEITVPLAGLYDSSITWSTNDEEVVIEEDKITLPARAEEWTLVITGTIANEEANNTLTFDYVVAADDGAIVAALVEEIEALPLWGDATLEDKVAIDAAKAKLDNLTDAQVAIFEGLETSGELTEKLESLLGKYIEIRGVVLSEEKATWEEVEVATGYEITFTDLGKTFTVATNEFVYADYGMPTDTKYNVEINVLTGDTTGYIGVGEAITEFGTPSTLPKVDEPIVYMAENQFSWDLGLYDGATAVRVYVDGVLRREVPIELGVYNYRFNGIAETNIEGGEEKEFVVQFVGNGTTHQSSEFITFTSPVTGAGSVLPSTMLYARNGTLQWNAGNWNQGYEVRFDDFRAYYTTYGTQIKTGSTFVLPLEETGLEAGTYNAKVRAMADNGGTPSAWSNTITFTITKGEVEGPANITFNNDECKLTWDATTNVIDYYLEIAETGQTFKVKENVFDLSVAELLGGDYTINMYTTSFIQVPGKNETTLQISKVSTLPITISVNDARLAKPENIVADYNGISWDAVENAVGYEVVVNGTTYNVTTNSFVFIENNLSMNFDYTLKIKALAEDVNNNSFFSSETRISTALRNVALQSAGATAYASQGNATSAIDGITNNSDWSTSNYFKENLGTDEFPIENPDYGKNPQIIITLNDVYDIYSFYVSWEGANAAEYDIEYSLDGETWELAYAFKVSPQGVLARVDEISLDTPIRAQYLRVTCLVKGSPYAYRMYTFAAFTLEETN